MAINKSGKIVHIEEYDFIVDIYSNVMDDYKKYIKKNMLYDHRKKYSYKDRFDILYSDKAEEFCKLFVFLDIFKKINPCKKLILCSQVHKNTKVTI